MEFRLQGRRTNRMSALVALDGRDVIAAFVEGGFRIARRERGCALLVRGVQVVVVPESGMLSTTRLQGLLERAEVQEKDLLSWLVRTGAAARSGSGFHQTIPVPAEERWREVDEPERQDVLARKQR